MRNFLHSSPLKKSRTKAVPEAEGGSIRLGDADIPFIVTRSRKRRRTIAFSLKAGSVQVQAPMRTSLPYIRSLLLRREGWITRRLDHQKQHGQNGPMAFKDGSLIPYLGTNYCLRVTRDTLEKSGCRLDGGTFVVNIPSQDLSAESLRRDVRLEVLLWFKRRAHTLINERMVEWAARLGVEYRRMAISSPRRLWGSCSVQNIIRINWRIIMAPPELVDYLVAHELSHVAYKDHSPRFWAFLERQMPDHRERRAALRRVETSLLTLWE